MKGNSRFKSDIENFFINFIEYFDINKVQELEDALNDEIYSTSPSLNSIVQDKKFQSSITQCKKAKESLCTIIHRVEELQKKLDSVLSRYEKADELYINFIRQAKINNEIQESTFEYINNKTQETISAIHDTEESIKKSLIKEGEILCTVLDDYTTEQKVAYNAIIKEVENMNTEKIIKDLTVLNFDINLLISKFSELINQHYGKGNNIENKLKSSNVGIKHKLKFIIPLLFLKYEAELELNNTQTLPKNWKEFKTLFIKNSDRL